MSAIFFIVSDRIKAVIAAIILGLILYKFPFEHNKNHVFKMQEILIAQNSTTVDNMISLAPLSDDDEYYDQYNDEGYQ